MVRKEHICGNRVKRGKKVNYSLIITWYGGAGENGDRVTEAKKRAKVL